MPKQGHAGNHHHKLCFCQWLDLPFMLKLNHLLAQLRSMRPEGMHGKCMDALLKVLANGSSVDAILV